MDMDYPCHTCERITLIGHTDARGKKFIDTVGIQD